MQGPLAREVARQSGSCPHPLGSDSACCGSAGGAAAACSLASSLEPPPLASPPPSSPHASGYVLDGAWRRTAALAGRRQVRCLVSGAHAGQSSLRALRCMLALATIALLCPFLFACPRPFRCAEIVSPEASESSDASCPTPKAARPDRRARARPASIESARVAGWTAPRSHGQQIRETSPPRLPAASPGRGSHCHTFLRRRDAATASKVRESRRRTLTQAHHLMICARRRVGSEPLVSDLVFVLAWFRGCRRRRSVACSFRHTAQRTLHGSKMATRCFGMQADVCRRRNRPALARLRPVSAKFAQFCTEHSQIWNDAPYRPDFAQAFQHLPAFGQVRAHGPESALHKRREHLVTMVCLVQDTKPGGPAREVGGRRSRRDPKRRPHPPAVRVVSASGVEALRA